MAQELSPFAATEASSTEASAWRKVDERLNRWSEWLNPILVKEARQAFKSNQFLITFMLLLAFGWVWSILGVVMQMPGVQFGSGASSLMVGYFLILVLPVLVIVPFSAFRSLAAEREDGTFEILSITTLNARQIVVGKLSSAVLQLLVYFSALAPCIAFTYLLRGLDVFTIGTVVCYTFVIALVLCCFSLLVATLTRSRTWQVLLSVALILVLFVVTFAWTMSMLEGLIWSGGGVPAYEPEYWPVNFTLVTAAGLLCALFIVIARGQISFASDNRSGPVRRMLLLIQVVALAWITYWQVYIQEEDYLIVMFLFAAFGWMLAGSLLTGESARLSPRVLRELPQSALGRMLFTWFNPGSGTGYMFAVINLATIFVYLVLVSWATTILGKGTFRITPKLFLSMGVTWCYVVMYLGLCRLIMLGLSRWIRPNLLLSLLLNVFMALAGCAVPMLVESVLNGFAIDDYTPLQWTNWMWTIGIAVDRDLSAHPLVPILVGLGAMIMLALQILTMGDEVWQTRLATPQRVVMDDQEQTQAGQTPERSDPWEEAGG